MKSCNLDSGSRRRDRLRRVPQIDAGMQGSKGAVAILAVPILFLVTGVMTAVSHLERLGGGTRREDNFTVSVGHRHPSARHGQAQDKRAYQD